MATKSGHRTTDSLAMLQDIQVVGNKAKFWETLARDEELLFYRPKKKTKKRKKKKGKAKAKYERAASGKKLDDSEEKSEEPVVAKSEEPVAKSEEPVVEEKPVEEEKPAPDEPIQSAEEPLAEQPSPKQDQERNSTELPASDVQMVVENADEEDDEQAEDPDAPAGEFFNVFFPTPDQNVREFSFMDLDQMADHLRKEAVLDANKQAGLSEPESSSDDKDITVEVDDKEGDQQTSNEVEVAQAAAEAGASSPEVKDDDEEKPDEEPKVEEDSDPGYTVTWEKRPLGIEVVRGEGGLNAWVRRVMDESIEADIKKGSYICDVNGRNVLGESYTRILKVIASTTGQIKILFKEQVKLPPIFPVGSTVKLIGLRREQDLNNAIGFIFAEMVDGRYPVKLRDTDDQVGVKPKNVELISEPKIERNDEPEGDDDDTPFNLSGSYKLKKVEGVNTFLKSQGMGWFKRKLKSTPKLKCIIIQEGNRFKITFVGPKGAVVDEFVADKTAFKGRTMSSTSVASKNAHIQGKELHVTEVNNEGQRKKVVFKLDGHDNLSVLVTNPNGVTMAQYFKRAKAGGSSKSE